MKFKRVFLIVLDSLGVGGESDSESYGDKGANTLGNIINYVMDKACVLSV